MDPAAELLERWQRDGDREALDSLLRIEVLSLKEQLRTRGRTMLGTSASASDVAQETVLRLLSLEELPRFDDPKAFQGYLFSRPVPVELLADSVPVGAGQHCGD